MRKETQKGWKGKGEEGLVRVADPGPAGGGGESAALGDDKGDWKLVRGGTWGGVGWGFFNGKGGQGRGGPSQVWVLSQYGGEEGGGRGEILSSRS